MAEKLIVGVSGNLSEHELYEIRQRVADHATVEPGDVLVLPGVVFVTGFRADDPDGLDDKERDALTSPFTKGTDRAALRQKCQDAANPPKEEVKKHEAPKPPPFVHKDAQPADKSTVHDAPKPQDNKAQVK